MSNPYLVCSDRELRILPAQWLLAEQWERAGNLLSDLNFIAAKTSQNGIDEVLQDYVMAMQLLPKENTWLEKIKVINRILDQQAYGLRNWNVQEQPAFFFQQIRQIRNNNFAQDLILWQSQAEADLVLLKKPYLLDRFPIHIDSTELRTLLGHQSSVYSVALSLDGQLAVSASLDSTLKVWDVATGQELRTLTGHEYGVTSVAMSYDGRLAVSASLDKTLKVWDVTTGKELRTLIGHSNTVNSVALTADGRLAVSASLDETLKVWDVTTGKELHTLKGHSYSVNSVAISHDGKVAVSASSDHTLKVWDVITGKELRTLIGHNNGVVAVSLSTNGQLAVSVSKNSEEEEFPPRVVNLKIWDVDTGRELHSLAGHRTVVSGYMVDRDKLIGIALSANNQLAVSVAWDKTIKVWDLMRGLELGTLIGHSSTVHDAVLSLDGQTVISASADHTLKVWDISSILSLSEHDKGGKSITMESELGTITVGNDRINDVAVSADGNLAISASNDNTIKVWDVPRGCELRTLQGHDSIVRNIALSMDGRIAISASLDMNLKVWDVATGQEIDTITRYINRHFIHLNSISLSGNGRLAVLSLTEDIGDDYPPFVEVLKVYDIAVGRELCTLERHSQSVYDIALSVDGRLAVSASIDKTLIVWDIRTGRELRTLKGHSEQVNGVALSADGQLAVSASTDKTLKVWDVTTGKELRTLRGHSEPVIGVALSADGQLAISTSMDQTIRVWNIVEGRCITSLFAGVSIERCAMSANGHTIVAGDSRGGFHLLEFVGANELLAKDVKIEKSVRLKKKNLRRKFERLFHRLLDWLWGLVEWS